MHLYQRPKETDQVGGGTSIFRLSDLLCKIKYFNLRSLLVVYHLHFKQEFSISTNYYLFSSIVYKMVNTSKQDILEISLKNIADL